MKPSTFWLTFPTMGIVIILLVVDIAIQLIHISKSKSIMATLAELKAEVESLKADLDAEQEQIKAAIDALNAAIAKLQEDVAGGGTAEDREALLNDIKAIRDDLKATIADEPTEPEA